MRTLLLLLIFMLNVQLFSQKIDSVGFLSAIKGKAICIRKGTEANLKIPFYFLNGDKIKIVDGNAVVVLFNEEEVKLTSGQSYSFAFDKDINLNNKDLLMFKNTKQSNSSFKMRGTGESKKVVFPKESKIVNLENAIIRLNTYASGSGYFFVLSNQETKQRVYELLNKDSASINLNTVALEKGAKYSWKMKFPEYEVFGELVVLTDEQVSQLAQFELINRASYIKAFNYYCSEACFFEAYHVIDKAIDAYPDDEYFIYLKSTLY